MLVSCDMEWNIEKTTWFIEDYHNSPELWNNRINDYKDSKIKNDKLNQLASKYDCTVIDVKKKIKNLRSAFHRERKKLKSRKSGSSSKKGKWFAFELLSFLLEVDLPRPTLSIAFSDEEDLELQEEEETESSQHPKAEVNESRNELEMSNKVDRNNCEEESKKCIVAKKTRKRASPSDREAEAYIILKNARKRDDCSTYGDYVANELQNLSPTVRTLVKHKINNILFEAAMGKYDTENMPTETTTALDNNVKSGSCTVLPSEASASTISE